MDFLYLQLDGPAPDLQTLVHQGKMLVNGSISAIHIFFQNTLHNAAVSRLQLFAPAFFRHDVHSQIRNKAVHHIGQRIENFHEPRATV